MWQEEEQEPSARQSDGMESGPFHEIVTVTRMGSGPGLVQDSPWWATFHYSRTRRQMFEHTLSSSHG